MVSFLEGLTRRPQRLIILATLCLLILSFTTWLSFSSTGSDTLKEGWGRLPPIGRPWANSPSATDPITLASPSAAPPTSLSDAYTFIQIDLNSILNQFFNLKE